MAMTSQTTNRFKQKQWAKLWADV